MYGREFPVRLQLIAILTIALMIPQSKTSVLGQDELSADRDAKKVMALMLLPQRDLSQSSALRQAVVRHLDRVSDEGQWLELATRFRLSESAPRLMEIAGESEQPANAARALMTLQRMKQLQPLLDAIAATQTEEEQEATSRLSDQEIETAAALAGRLHLVANPNVQKWLSEQVALADRYPASVAFSLVRSFAALPQGPNLLLRLAESDQLPASIRLVAGSELARHRDQRVREAAARVLPPPMASNRELSPLSELIQRRGEVSNGQKVFAGIGTCSKCHVVNNQGSSVGPDLSEIGSKLARDAMYTAILDPSAAISHNYENYAVQTLDGKLVTGLLTSESDEKVVLKSAEGVPVEIAREDIDEMKKLEQSLMPEDLARPMSEQDLVDLVEYLTTLKKAE